MAGNRGAPRSLPVQRADHWRWPVCRLPWLDRPERIRPFAHSGGTDAKGCHRNHKTNDYHCHCRAKSPAQGWAIEERAMGARH
ncbi:YHYH domain-containing protein [Pseudomonas atacamensis]|uniref:YHYH domain-containing protein n=1 Tax=Pseudomonas atacamensis TaxID=2565368 RepID=UPI00300F121A